MTSTTVTRTLRLDPELNSSIAASAEREGVSPSHIVNQALRRTVEWDAFAQKFGFVSVPASLMNRLMDNLSEEQARELGRWVGKNHVREFLTFWFKEVSPRNVVQGYPRLTAKYGRAFEYEERADGGRWVIILKHGSGRKWSAYYEELLRAVFSDIVQRQAAIESSEHQVVARFSLA